jgi:hypothetical protein
VSKTKFLLFCILERGHKILINKQNISYIRWC